MEHLQLALDAIQAVDVFWVEGAKFWNPETAVVCHVDVAQVTAEGSWSLSTGLLPDQGQGNEDVRTFPIIGKEQRLNIALGYRTSIYIAEVPLGRLSWGGWRTPSPLRRTTS